jgi:hypothetical protein
MIDVILLAWCCYHTPIPDAAAVVDSIETTVEVTLGSGLWTDTNSCTGTNANDGVAPDYHRQQQPPSSIEEEEGKEEDDDMAILHYHIVNN